MSGRMRIAVMASGSGSNFQAIADAVRAGAIGGSLELLICDKPSAPVVERARREGIEAFAFSPRSYAAKADYELEMVQRLQERRIDLVVLAGYMRIVSNVLLEPFAGRLINIHPSLLPAFPGMNAIGQALDSGVKWTGVTVHFVDNGMDTGPIIAQQPVPLFAGDTVESAAERIQQAEHKLLPEVVQAFCEGRVTLNGRRAVML